MAARPAAESPFTVAAADLPPRLAQASNPSFGKPGSFFDLAKVAFSSYGTDPNLGKIALYDAGKTSDGKPVVLVNLTGTEMDATGRLANTPANWLGAGSGARTDFERETVASIQDAYRRGEIPKGAVLDFTGHSLGGIVANNISGRNFGIRGSSGQIPVTGPDGKTGFLPIRNVVSFGAPLPSVWSDKVNYVQRVGPADVVANVPTDQVGGARVAQWKTEPQGPAHLDRQKVHLAIPTNDLADGGHLQYDRGSSNPLRKQPLPPALQYSGPLRLIAAFKDPAIQTPVAINKEVGELSNLVLSKPIEAALDTAYPQWRSWLGSEANGQLSKLSPNLRNEINSGLNAFFSTYLDSDRFKNAGPAERQQIVNQDEGRLRDTVLRIVQPLASEEAQQAVANVQERVQRELSSWFPGIGH